jgi:SNF2 family DNA or RNA helicase
MDIEKKLYSYQIPHFYQLEEILKVRNVALDASDTGTGKTAVALALGASLNMSVFPIVPKSVIPSWMNMAKEFGVDIFGIANYEMLKSCKYYTSKMEKVTCPFIDKYKKTDPSDRNPKVSERRIIDDYYFQLPSNVLVVFDEAHRCKNYKSITSRLLLSVCKTRCRLLLLSATIADKLECFKPFGIVFGFYNDTKLFMPWLRRIRKIKEREYNKKNMKENEISLDIIHTKIFPNHGSRMKIKDLGSLFPQNQVLSQAYSSDNKEEINKQYEIIKEAYEELKQKHLFSEGLGKLIRARMKIEMLKVPIMIDIIQEGLDSGYGVVIFVNYLETLHQLAYYFDTDSVVHGNQSIDERQSIIDNFQNNKTNIIILISQAGGVGISLQDLHGIPRMSVISPTWSGEVTMQILGRIHRVGAKTPALQRFVYIADTYEEEICKIIKQKLVNITTLNDRDLIGPVFTHEEYEEFDNINNQIIDNENINIDDENIDNDDIVNIGDDDVIIPMKKIVNKTKIYIKK